MLQKSTQTRSTNSPKNHGVSSSGSQTGKQKIPMVPIVIGILVFVGIIAIVLMFTQQKQQKPKEQKKESYTTLDTASAGARPQKNPNYSQSSNNGDSQRPPQNLSQMTTSSKQDQQPTGPLKYYIDPVLNVKMVQTPAGPKSINSPEGQKFINDYNKLQSELNPNGSSQKANTDIQAINQSQALNANLVALQETTNNQIKSLDEKLNAAYETIDSLQQVIKKQNETVVSLANQIKNIQPTTNTPKDLAKQMFGKDGERILKSHNNTVKVDSIVGNKAYITDSEGNTNIVSVGDLIPNSTLIVKEIDPSTNTVIVAN